MRTNIAEKILKEAKNQGATSAELMLIQTKGLKVTVRMGEVDIIEHASEKDFSVTVYLDQKTGTASSSEISENAIKTTVKKAINIASFTQNDPCNGLAEKELLAFDYPNLNLSHPWKISPERAVELATQCEAIGLAKNKRIKNSEGATVSTQASQCVYANSHGFLGQYKTTRHGMNCMLIAEDAHMMQRDYDYTVARDVDDLVNIEALATNAAKRTVNRLGAKKINTCQVPVIFEASLARGLLSTFVCAISGSALYRKSSFLLDHLNKKVFPECINITENPHLPKALGSSPFDSEGVTTKQREIVNNGVLQSYVLGSYSARKLGLQTTGNADGVHNLIINSTHGKLTDLYQLVNTGLLVTELIGQGVNLITGDYSRGAFGYWIENGEIKYPVQEITIAGNLKDMFLNLKASSGDIDSRGNIQSGSLLIDNMTVAGN